MKSATIHGFRGEGRTISEAKADAKSQIEHVARNLTPYIYAHRGTAVVIHSTEYGFSYTLTHPDSAGRILSTCSLNCSLDEAIDAAVSHLLSATREPGEYSLPDWTEFCLLNCEELVDSWRRSDAFQSAYRHGEAIGATDPHHYACQHVDDFAVIA